MQSHFLISSSKQNGITPFFILSTYVYNIHKYYENVPHSDNNILTLVQT